MFNMYIAILFTELVIFLGVLGFLFLVTKYRETFPKQEVENFYATNEEEIFDTGFMNDINDFNTRMDEIKEKLNDDAYELIPAVEIIDERNDVTRQ